jgi:hypothetical protein
MALILGLRKNTFFKIKLRDWEGEKNLLKDQNTRGVLPA